MTNTMHDEIGPARDAVKEAKDSPVARAGKLNLNAVISLGPHTDTCLDAHGLPDELIPHLHQMITSVRHSRWMQVLQGEGWNLDASAAVALSQALLADVMQNSGPESLNSRIMMEYCPSRLSVAVHYIRLIFELILVAILCFLFWG